MTDEIDKLLRKMMGVQPRMAVWSQELWAKAEGMQVKHWSMIADDYTLVIFNDAGTVLQKIPQASPQGARDWLRRNEYLHYDDHPVRLRIPRRLK